MSKSWEAAHYFTCMHIASITNFFTQRDLTVYVYEAKMILLSVFFSVAYPSILVHWLVDLCAGIHCDVSSELASESSCNVRAATVALGNTWSHCVNTRLIVQYVDEFSRQVFTTFIGIHFMPHSKYLHRHCWKKLAVCLLACEY